MGDFCTCRITCKQEADGTVSATLFATHYNHHLDNSHRAKLPISERDKTEICNRLSQGVKPAKIMADIQREGSTLPAESLRPVHLRNAGNIYTA